MERGARGEEDSRDTCGLTHLYMCMDHLKMTSHVFLYDGVAAASLGQTTIYPVHERRGQNDRRLYVPPFAGLQAVSPAPMVTQTFRRVPPEITTAKHKSGRLATDRRSPTGCGGTDECVHTSHDQGTQRADDCAWTVDGQPTDAAGHS